MSTPHPRPFYYLENFQTALAWLRQRYDDLLNDAERAFMGAFEALPKASSALLVRMIMRKGALFRTGKLEYGEIGCPRAAAAPLVDLGWLDDQPLLGLGEAFALLRKAEIAAAFRLTARLACGSERRAAGDARGHVRRAPHLRGVVPGRGEVVYRVRVLDLCERLRLMFFGNFDQNWSEFVLADLGIFNYEKVAVPASARAFQRREHIEDFHAIYRCRESFHREESGEAILASVPPPIADNAWLESRRAKLLFRVGQRYEKKGISTRR